MCPSDLCNYIVRLILLLLLLGIKNNNVISLFCLWLADSLSVYQSFCDFLSLPVCCVRGHSFPGHHSLCGSVGFSFHTKISSMSRQHHHHHHNYLLLLPTNYSATLLSILHTYIYIFICTFLNTRCRAFASPKSSSPRPSAHNLARVLCVARGCRSCLCVCVCLC